MSDGEHRWRVQADPLEAAPAQTRVPAGPVTDPLIVEMYRMMQGPQNQRRTVGTPSTKEARCAEWEGKCH